MSDKPKYHPRLSIEEVAGRLSTVGLRYYDREAILSYLGELNDQDEGDRWGQHLRGVPHYETYRTAIEDSNDGFTSWAPYTQKKGTVSREDWLQALESGEHQQNHDDLFGSVPSSQLSDPVRCRSASTCCLGVAPKLAGLPFGVPNLSSFDEEISLLKPTTEVAACLIEDMTTVETEIAIRMNDRLRMPFLEIAQVFRLMWDMPRHD